MVSIGFAFVVATCLFLWFSQTRALGVIGVFILLCVNPLLFATLFVLGAYVWNRWLRKRYYPLPPFLPKDNRKNALIPLLALPWLGGSIPTAEPPTGLNATLISPDVVQASPDGDRKPAPPG